MKKPTAILTIGPSASGKTTWANNYVNGQKNNNWQIICRDDVRRAIFNFTEWKDYKFSHENERLVTSICYKTMEECRLLNKNIIIADTNLNKSNRETLVKFLMGLGYQVKTEEFHTRFDELCKRDEQRVHSVGRQVIYKQYKSFQAQFGRIKPYKNTGLKPCIICDVDQTLTYMSPKRGPFDWNKVSLDLPKPFVIQTVIAIVESTKAEFIIFSGRSEVCKEDTVKWLNDNGLSPDQIHMRPEGNTQKDWIVKLNLFNTHVKGKFDVFCVFDDRPQVCQVWNDLGLNLFQVGDYRNEF